MFIYRFIRGILALIGLLTVGFFVMKYYDGNNPIVRRIEAIKNSTVVTESVKDIKSLAGSVVEGVGKDMQGEVTKDEKQKLDDIFAKELAATKQTDSNTTTTKKTESTQPTADVKKNIEIIKKEGNTKEVKK